jgi:hypothetical protein
MRWSDQLKRSPASFASPRWQGACLNPSPLDIPLVLAHYGEYAGIAGAAALCEIVGTHAAEKLACPQCTGAVATPMFLSAPP